jgi:hypothetical protein
MPKSRPGVTTHNYYDDDVFVQKMSNCCVQLARSIWQEPSRSESERIGSPMNATTESKKDGPVLVHWYIRTSLLLKSFVLGGSIQRLQYLYISMGSSKKSLTSFFGAHFIQVQVCKRQLGKTSFSSCMSLLYKVATVCIHATGASKELSAFHRHFFFFFSYICWP